MIADDIDAIRAGIRKLNNDKIIAEAEAAKRAAEECKPAKLPDTKNLFPEQGAPFRGFFVTEDGDIRPFDMPDEQAAIFGTPPGGSTTIKATMGGYSVSNERVPNRPEDWADWLDTQQGDSMPCSMDKSSGIDNGGTVNQSDADPWDNVTLDGGSYMWGQL